MDRNKILAEITAMNTMLSSLAHYLANCVSAISTSGQLTELDKAYADKFLDITMIQVQKMIDVLAKLNEFNNKIQEKTKAFADGKEDISSFEKEIISFRKSFEKITTSKISMGKYSFHPDDK